MPQPARTIRVFADTVQVGKCRGENCGKRIWFAQTVNTGKRMPFDGEPVPVKTEDDPSGRTVWLVLFEDSHFRSCPDANDFSHTRPRK